MKTKTGRLTPQAEARNLILGAIHNLMYELTEQIKTGNIPNEYTPATAEQVRKHLCSEQERLTLKWDFSE